MASDVRTAAGLLRVRGARTHNLQNVDVDIPLDQLVVLTGVSGSGKSSLAFDTIFAEGQRRYLESLSAGARRWLDQMERPDVDDIDGLPPTLSVEQRAGSIQPRSTLATLTEIHDFLRLLYARAGTAHCPQCGEPVSQQSPQAIVEAILALEEGRKVMLLAPLVRGRKGTHRELFEEIVRDGFVRVRVDGEIFDAASPPELKKSKPHTIEVVIDRIVVRDGLRGRLQESVELALKNGEGTCIVSIQIGEDWYERLFSSRFACAKCEVNLPEVEPRTFSFNSPYGACPACDGLGVIPPEGVTSQSLDGSKPAVSRDPDWLVNAPICPDCDGARIGPVGRAARFEDVAIQDFLALTVAGAYAQSTQWQDHMTGVPPVIAGDEARHAVVSRVLPEITNRLQFLRQVGLDYLTLDRPALTLSGGELQRARLAGCLGAGLLGVCYVLDEPTIGLHPRDTERLLKSLIDLRDQGNSVLVVEHDPDVMRFADWLIDLGPGAGGDGGRIIAQGTFTEVSQNANSVTGRYLASVESHPHEPDNPPSSVPCSPNAALLLENASARNLQHVTAQIPLGHFTCVTGVSGSGKSTLIMETLVPLVRAELAARLQSGMPGEMAKWRNGEMGKANETIRTTSPFAPSARLSGSEHLDRLIVIDQSPLGRNARSNPATASGMWDEIRRVFAKTRDARVRGFRASRFSFNASGGRCEECKGQGTRCIGMHFLPDVTVACPVCNGARFNRATLQIRYRGKSVADVLDLRIDEAVEFFASFADLNRTLRTFADVGLGYLSLGQSATTLSGGEAQRIKLATELSRPSGGRTLYVLDEPTTGLHPADVERLLHLLRRLVAQGHTVVVIDHHLDVIAAADWVIDLGPEGGPEGGRLVAAGSPAEIAACEASYTGQVLRRRRHV